MCGICAVLSFRENNDSVLVRQCIEDATIENLGEKLQRRGPNNFHKTFYSYQDILDVNCISSVLHLRGTIPVFQPIEDENGNFLLWNGEIFGGLLVDNKESDVKILSEKLFHCKSETDIIHFLSHIKGPFAFIFYQANGLLWFGRDIFGRRSLLWNANKSCFWLSSLANTEDKWNEVPTQGIFCIDINQSYANKAFSIHLYPWSSSPSGLSVQPKNEEMINEYITMTVNANLQLDNPVSKLLNRCLPSGDILSNFTVIVDKEQKCSDSATLSKLYQLDELRKAVYEFEEVLAKAVELRVHNHQHLCKDCYAILDDEVHCDHSSVGILFSGGLDSIVIACLADRYLKEDEPIDLLNVAFANSQNIKGVSDESKISVFNTPDRITGRNGTEALRKICPKRTWNFVEVNVTEVDLVEHRTSTISHLLHPSCTVLDDSIGCALWFAAQGNGIISSNKGYINYKSPVRILLLGMGADEQLGGYSRHRGKFSSCGWSGLIEELSMELDRIGSRNLGRDDRIIADHGVESRYPFLDEDVVSFLNQLPVWLKMNLNYGRGVGEKLLLRLMAFKLGLTEAAVLPKRAIQFGSRIARIENSKEKGSDVCERLKVIS